MSKQFKKFRKNDYYDDENENFVVRSNYIQKKTGIDISLGYNKNKLVLENGDVVHRHMMDGGRRPAGPHVAQHRGGCPVGIAQHRRDAFYRGWHDRQTVAPLAFVKRAVDVFVRQVVNVGDQQRL